MAQRSVDIEIDDREFRRALAKIIETDKKELAFVLNDQGVRLCQEAIKQTRKATGAKIRADLNRGSWISSKVFSKTGKRLKRPKKERARYSLAESIIAKRDWNFHKVRPSNVKERAQRMIDVRVKSIGFLRAGYIPAIQVFIRANGGRTRSNFGGAKSLGTPHGKGIPARASWNPVATIINYAIKPWGRMTVGKRGNPMKYALAGMRAAIPARVADMKKKIEQRLERAHRPYQGR